MHNHLQNDFNLINNKNKQTNSVFDTIQIVYYLFNKIVINVFLTKILFHVFHVESTITLNDIFFSLFKFKYIFVSKKRKPKKSPFFKIPTHLYFWLNKFYYY